MDAGAIRRTRRAVTRDHVGRRVSFQFELPNGYLGEVVGTLAWYDEAAETFVVRDRHDRLHRVPAKGVRFSKVVE